MAELALTAEARPAARSGAELRRATWELAWPVIIAFSVESLVGLCDMLMVGRLGRDAVAAVGVGVQILSAVNSVLFAVGTGALAVVARQIGGGTVRAAAETLRQSIVAAVVLSVVTVLPVLVWAPALVAVFRVDPAVAGPAVAFVRIVMLSVPGAAVVFVIASSLRGGGDTRTPLAIGATVGVLNVLAGWSLIFGHVGLPPLGVRGSAAGTVIAFTAGAALAVALLARGRLVMTVRWRPFRVRPDLVRRVLRVGYPAALEHLVMQVGFFAYIFFAARYGTAPVAAYFIGARVLSISFLPGLGFAIAAGTMVGQQLGAARPGDAERAGWSAMRLGLGLMTGAGVVLFIAARPIARLFVDDPEVVADAVLFIRVLAACQPLMAIDFTLGGALRGAGDTRFPLFSALVSFWACRLGFAWLVAFVLHLDIVWLWFAVVGDYVARAGLKGWRFRGGVWKHVRV